MTWIERAGRRLYCFEAGAGKPVILLHGSTLSGRCWAPQVPALSASGHHVIVPDMAAHGASDPVNGTIGIDDLVNDIRAIMDARGIAKADIVGVSLGGTLALAVALAMPERLDRLVIVNALADTTSAELRSTVSQWTDTLRGTDGPLRLLDSMWPFSLSEAFRDSDQGKATYQSWHGVAARIDGPAMARVLEGVCGFDARDGLPSIAARTLVVGGALDPMAAGLQRWSSTIPDARYVEIAGAGHIANVDQAAAFTRELVGFLA